MPVEFKIPESVLVIIHTPQLQVLLLERADHLGFWQSVTGSKERLDEPLFATAMREVLEETGISVPRMALRDWGVVNEYPIYPHWQHRYAPGVTSNIEHVFSLCVAPDTPVKLAPREHVRSQWLTWERAADLAFSWSNAKAIRGLPRRVKTGVKQ